MINTNDLLLKVGEYTNLCERERHAPSANGLSKALSVAPQTVRNVLHGTYNGRIYTEQPHPKRCIDNKDFSIIRDALKI